MEVTTLEKSTFDVLASFLQAMETENVNSSIFYLMLNGDQSVDIQSEQIPWIYSFVENNLPEVDVCYGVGNKQGDGAGITIMLFLGFKDKSL